MNRNHVALAAVLGGAFSSIDWKGILVSLLTAVGSAAAAALVAWVQGKLKPPPPPDAGATP